MASDQMRTSEHAGSRVGNCNDVCKSFACRSHVSDTGFGTNVYSNWDQLDFTLESNDMASVYALESVNTWTWTGAERWNNNDRKKGAMLYSDTYFAPQNVTKTCTVSDTGHVCAQRETQRINNKKTTSIYLVKNIAYNTHIDYGQNILFFSGSFLFYSKYSFP